VRQNVEMPVHGHGGAAERAGHAARSFAEAGRLGMAQR
jgi:hypothetical protein